MLTDQDFKLRYSSETDDIYNDFYVPALENAVNFKRAVGYFSIGVLLNAPAALSSIVEKNGKIKVIFAKIVSERDLDQLKKGLDFRLDDELPSFMNIIQQNRGHLIEYRIKVLAYLFRRNLLEVKVAFRRNGLFHQKIGILEDGNGNKISFNGSMNETASALDPELNSEEITIFRSWETGQKEYVHMLESDFDRLWSNESSDNTIVCSLPEALRQELNIISEDSDFTPSAAEETRLVNSFLQKSKDERAHLPRLPKTIKGQEFEIRPHQRQALENWKCKNFKGILELATGTGKTITSIYGIVKISESISGLSVVISVPYVDLAEQWVKELRLFNIFAVRCYGSSDIWEPLLRSYLLRNQTSQNEFIAIVVVNKTLKGDKFQSIIRDLDPEKLLFVGDECHHHIGMSYSKVLPNQAKFKLGLSATPFHYIDEVANDRLRNFYGDVVYTYSLFEAINNGILSPYEYYPIPVLLTTEETDEYFALSEKIGKAIAVSSRTADVKDERLNSLLMRRARLVGTASNKLRALERLIVEKGVPNHSLFYCSDGKVSEGESDSLESDDDDDPSVKQRIAVAKLLRAHGVKASFFTADESPSQRASILESFKLAEVSSLVAIKCLDEGIDVPACSTAYILASSRNPRQFVQRRGRILRKSPGKDRAVIYDFVVVLPLGAIDENERAEDFFRAELIRVGDFARHALNHLSSVRSLELWLDQYDLHHLTL
jgi:superfamily II DNA or RNA helicase